MRFITIGSVTLNVDQVAALQRFPDTGDVTVHLVMGSKIAGIAQCTAEAFDQLRHQLTGHADFAVGFDLAGGTDTSVESRYELHVPLHGDPHPDGRMIAIVVNGRTREITPGDLSFAQICCIAGVGHDATVTYRTSKQSVTLRRGQHIRAEEGMIIDAVVMNKA